jgi:hypothetical protein
MKGEIITFNPKTTRIYKAEKQHPFYTQRKNNYRDKRGVR